MTTTTALPDDDVRSADLETGLAQAVLDLGNRQGAVVKHRCSQDGVGTGSHRLDEVRHLAGPARGDEWDVDCPAYRLDHLDVETIRGAVSVHGVEQDLSGSSVDGLTRPLNGIKTGRTASTVGGHPESGGLVWFPSCVDRQHDDLVAESVGDLVDDPRVCLLYTSDAADD